MTVSAD